MCPGRFSCYRLTALSAHNQVPLDIKAQVSLGVEVHGSLGDSFQEVKFSVISVLLETLGHGAVDLQTRSIIGDASCGSVPIFSKKMVLKHFLGKPDARGGVIVYDPS
jgi:hypothetical protein